MPDLYRFRGRYAPSSRKVPIRAAVSGGDVVDGIATLRLYDPIDSWGGYWGTSAKEFVEALDGLDDSVEQIHLHINSPGGEVWEAVAITNALRNHPARVTAFVDGLAASAASFIAAAADELVMGRNTELMIHDAWGIGIGPAADMRELADRLDKISDNIAGMYAAKAGGTVAHWRELMLAETWYDPDEAVAASLADRVEGSTDDQAEERQPDGQADGARDRWDLSVFAYPGRAAAPAPATGASRSPALEPGGVNRAARFEQRRAARHTRRAARHH